MKSRLAGFTLLIALAAFASHAQLLDPGLQSRLALPNNESLRVVVTFNHVPTLIDRILLGSVASRFQLLNALPMALVETNTIGVRSLLGRASIRSIYLDRQLQYYLHQSVPLIGADRVHNELGFDGSGVTVGLIDSGIYGVHPDLPYGSKVVQNVKIAGDSEAIAVPLENLPDSDTSSGHGTHCAGVIGGSGAAASGYFAGVAPGAKLVGVGTGDAIFIFTALEGFDYVLQKQATYGIRVISNSWGTTGVFDANDPVNVASKAAHDHGITVVFAAGNDGPGNNTLNPYSVAPWVIGVAAGNKDGQTLADFSSRGIPGDPVYVPAITAPGVSIVSTRAPGTALPILGITEDVALDPTQLPYYTTMSGTSMATPHVAGVCALLLQANPSLTPDQVKQAIVSTATPMPGYSAFEVGAGYINAFAAANSVSH
jgi:serine protease AprX